MTEPGAQQEYVYTDAGGSAHVYLLHKAAHRQWYWELPASGDRDGPYSRWEVAAYAVKEWLEERAQVDPNSIVNQVAMTDNY